MVNNELEKEKTKLQEIIENYKEVIDDLNIKLEHLPNMYRDNPLLLENLLRQYSNQLNMVKRTIGKPYFARIDFKADTDSAPEICYIGKVGVLDFDNNTITVDWRAPISSLYYDSNVGKTSYIAPMGQIDGELLLKRQFEISDSELLSFQDVDTVANDELLKPYLNASADNRLKNIVSTIQGEQNKIIRERIYKNMIIQGVAGSGKTTVALHRIAYLVYNNRDKIKPNQYMVIGPNKFFINYISGVLPDLDVNDVSQLTYGELVQQYLGEDFSFNSSDEKLISYISNESDLSIEKYKSSMRYKEAIDLFLEDFYKQIVPNKDLEFKGFVIVPKEVIADIYYNLDRNTYPTIEKRVERTILVVSQYIKTNKDKILDKISNYIKEDRELFGIYYKNNALIQKELTNGCIQTLKKYFSKSSPKATNLYLEFVKNIEKYIDDQYVNVKDLKKQTLDNCKKRSFDFEDLPALMYLQEQIGVGKKLSDIRHVVIDEAQDYGTFHFYSLKQGLPKCSFSIFGDLAQSIYSYRSIKDWDSVVNNIFNGECTIENLAKSYRTTIEIMDTASNITDYIGLGRAKPVIRHGESVNFIETNNINECILNKLNEYVSKSYNSIAIIAKNEVDATKINEYLIANGINTHNIIGSNEYYDGGICTTTSYLSKGLEFDAVIISDASEYSYSSENDIEMKLLYVAMTRPLHELSVLYQSPLTKSLQRCLKQKD